MGAASSKNTPLPNEIVDFYDKLEEFNDYCSFFCDAMSSLYTETTDCEPDIHTIMGARRHCHWIKSTAEELKIEMDKIQELYCTNEKVTQLRPDT